MPFLSQPSILDDEILNISTQRTAMSKEFQGMQVYATYSLKLGRTAQRRKSTCAKHTKTMPPDVNNRRNENEAILAFVFNWETKVLVEL